MIMIAMIIAAMAVFSREEKESILARRLRLSATETVTEDLTEIATEIATVTENITEITEEIMTADAELRKWKRMIAKRNQ